MANASAVQTERLESAPWARPERSTIRLTAIRESNALRDPLLGLVVAGRYRIERELGRGGMGVVYAGSHLALDRPVAIKVLPSALALDADVLRRFEREARAASRIKHPHVVSVFDLGRLPTGEPYLAMELLEGHDLDHEIGLGRLHVHEVMAILTQLASALDALHAEGFVHRDIKPSNVFLAREASGRTVKLVDFGLATLAAPPSGAERLTRVGQVVGTPAYLSPESARGELCDARGDVYSLGVVAFELLTGAMPFEGEPMAVLLEKLARPAPSLTEIARLPFSDAVEQVVARALDRDPARRQATAGELVAALTAALAASPLRAFTEQRAVVRGAQPETRRATFAITLLAAIALGATTMVVAARPRTVISSTPVSAHVPTSVPVHVTPPAVEAEPEVAVEVLAPPSVPVPTTTGAVPHAHGLRIRHVTAQPSAPAAAPIALVPAASTAPASLTHADALVHDATGAMVHGQLARARTLYAEATTAAPQNAAAWRGLGLASERQHLVPEARRAYERYLELAPHAADAATVRGRLERLP